MVFLAAAASGHLPSLAFVGGESACYAHRQMSAAFAGICPDGYARASYPGGHRLAACAAFKSRLQVHNKLTDETTKTKPGKRLPTEHCGYLQITYDTVLIGDYLGLWRRRLRKGESVGIYIEPKPVACDLPEQLQSRSVSLWKPKPGGGFSENHDLRLYRPGDDLRSIHWKMTAKTGKLIYREPIVPAQQGYLLTMTLCGDPDTLDKKLGQLLYVSEILLKRQIPHGVCCRTGEGTVEYTVTDVHSLKKGLHQLLQSAPAVGETDFRGQNVLWQYHIGGDGNEER
jgi:hypothetical protein